MKLLITGGCGFLGSNLAAEAISLGDTVTIVDNLSRKGTDRNLEWLKSLGRFDFHQISTGDMTRLEPVVAALKPDRVFHLAGQALQRRDVVVDGVAHERMDEPER